jgi:hypothetical protein
MRLCGYWTQTRPSDPLSPCAAGPLLPGDNPELLRCARCSGWTPHGGLPSIERVAILTREITSLTTRLADDYAWAHGIAFAPGSGNGAGRRRGGHSDPTGGVIADQTRITVRAYTAIAARLLEGAVRSLRNADEAIGDALYAAEPPGPKDHTPAPFHDPATLYPGRPDLAEAHAAQDRRHIRGEGIPT